MKTMKYLFSMLLALSCSIQAMAQMAVEDGEAFYIYRNDGDFNGFFYDDVQEMRYSKIGIDSLEYDDFVVQEVVTADSIYRIPLCAIDSIGFVQPEIQLNPRLKNMDELGMLEYLNPGRWPGKIKFTPYLPHELIPEVGDVLVSFNEREFSDTRGMGCRVTHVDVRDYEISVEYEPLTSLHDIFTRFITVEQITSAADGSRSVRMAGARQMQAAMSPQRRAVSYDSDIFKFNGTLSHEFQNGNKSISAALNIGIRVRLNVCYDIDMDHIFMKTSMSEDLSLQTSFAASYSGTWEPPIAEKLQQAFAIRFPAQFPIFETHPVPNVFFRTNGTLELKTSLPPISYFAKQLVIFSDRTGSMLNCRFNHNLKFLEPDKGFFESTESALSLNGFVQGGIRFNADIATNSWVKDFFHGEIGIKTYVGPKLSGSLTCDLAQLASGNYYESISNSAVTLSLCNVDMEASASIFCKGIGSEKEKFAEVNYAFDEGKRYLVPRLETFDIKRNDGDLSSIDVDMKWTNKLLINKIIKVGYVIKRYNPASQDWDDEDMYETSYADSICVINANFRGLKAGSYNIIPFVKLPLVDDVIYLNNRYKAFDIYPKVEFVEDRYYVPAGTVGGENVKLDIPFKTNIVDGEIGVYAGVSDGEESTVEWTPGVGGVVHLSFKPNEHWWTEVHQIHLTVGRAGSDITYVEQAPNIDFNAIHFGGDSYGTYHYVYNSSRTCEANQKDDKTYDTSHYISPKTYSCTVSLENDSIMVININDATATNISYGTEKKTTVGTLYFYTKSRLLRGNINYTCKKETRDDDKESGIRWSSLWNEDWSLYLDAEAEDPKNRHSFSYKQVYDYTRFNPSHRNVKDLANVHACHEENHERRTFEADGSDARNSFFFKMCKR